MAVDAIKASAINSPWLRRYVSNSSTAWSDICGSRGTTSNRLMNLASEMDIGGVSARVFSAEHLAAIALLTGRAKDKARLLMFWESETFNKERFQEIAARHGLLDAWQRFMVQFVEEQH